MRGHTSDYGGQVNGALSLTLHYVVLNYSQHLEQHSEVWLLSQEHLLAVYSTSPLSLDLEGKVNSATNALASPAFETN